MTTDVDCGISVTLWRIIKESRVMHSALIYKIDLLAIQLFQLCKTFRIIFLD
jgi:hypothetical protein